MKKIAVICTLYGPNGGTGRVTTELFERYAKDGNEVHVFASEIDKDYVKNSAVSRFTHLPITRIGVLKQLHLLVKSSLAVKKKEYDLVYATGDYYYHPDVVTIHGLKKHGRKQIEKMERDGILKRNISFIKYLARQIYCPLCYELGEQLVYRKKNIVFVGVSQGASQDFEKNFNQKALTIDNGVDFEKYKFNEEARVRIRNRFHLNEDRTVLLFVGSEWGRKRLDVAIKTCALLGNTELLVLGHDDIQAYQKMASDFGCEDRVHFVGFSKQIEDYFSAADIFLFPSAYETFGLVALEAMAAGRIVIANPVNGVKDFISHRKNGLLVQQNQAEEYAEWIRQVETNAEWKVTMQNNAVQSAKSMSWTACYEKYKQLFDEYHR